MADMEKNLDHSKARIAELETTDQDRDSQLLRAEKEAATSRIAQVELSKSAVEKTLKEAEDKIRSLELQKEESAAQVSGLNERHLELEDQSTEARAHVDLLGAEKDALTTEVETLKSEVSNVDTRLRQEMESQEIEARGLADTLRAQVESSKAELEEASLEAVDQIRSFEAGNCYSNCSSRGNPIRT
jgi:chromosome segregation ATPase